MCIDVCVCRARHRAWRVGMCPRGVGHTNGTRVDRRRAAPHDTVGRACRDAPLGGGCEMRFGRCSPPCDRGGLGAPRPGRRPRDAATCRRRRIGVGARRLHRHGGDARPCRCRPTRARRRHGSYRDRNGARLRSPGPDLSVSVSAQSAAGALFAIDRRREACTRSGLISPFFVIAQVPNYRMRARQVHKVIMAPQTCLSALVSFFFCLEFINKQDAGHDFCRQMHFRPKEAKNALLQTLPVSCCRLLTSTKLSMWPKQKIIKKVDGKS